MRTPRSVLRATALAATMAVAALVAGCGAGAGDDPNAPVTIRFAWWGNTERAETTRAVLDAFQAANPTITVETETGDFNSYFNRLATQTAARDAPDVMTLGGAYPREYSDRGALLNLDELDEPIDISQFPPTTLDAARFDGELYALPTGGNAIGMLLNPDVFAAAGVPLPDTDTWTWEEFADLAAQISAASPEGTVGYEPQAVDAIYTWAAQRDTPIFDADGQIAVSAATIAEYFELERTMLASGAIPSAERVAELVNVNPEQTLMGQGRAAMTVGYSNLLTTYSAASGIELSLVQVPGETQHAQAGATVLPSQYYAISSTSAHPEAAAKLLSFLVNSPEAGNLILDDRGLPFNTEVRETIVPQLGAPSQASAAYLDIVQANGTPAQPIPPAGGSAINDIIARLDSDVLFGRIEPAAAAETMLAELQASVDSAR